MESPTPPIHPQPLARRTTASSLLVKFVPGIRTEHKKEQKVVQEPIRNTPVTYAEAESSYPPPPEHAQSQYVDLTENDNEDVIEVQGPTQQSPADDAETNTNDEDEIVYGSSKRRLRVRKPNASLKAIENGFETPRRPRPKKKDALSDLVGAHVEFSPVVSNRVAIRQEIASKTAAYRDRFFVEKKEFWLPLLPQHNYVRKLVAKHNAMSEAERADLPTITPYEEIDTQPRGVKATMKPYQLSGLSFMVYLHRNVCKV